MRILFILCMSYALVAGCQTRQRLRAAPLQQTRGMPVDMNAADGFGLNGELSWKASTSAGEGGFPTVWAGDIWTNLQGGLAHRFVLPSGREKSLSSFLHYSPAEKYDLLISLTQSEADAKKIAPAHAALTTPKTGLLQSQFYQILASKNAQDTKEAEGAPESVVSGLTKKAEADLTKFQSQRDLLTQELKKGATPSPGSSGLWSYSVSQLDMTKKHWMGTEALSGFSRGWSAASLTEKAPQSAVLTKHGEETILFTQADIQGLLSFLWEEQAPEGSVQTLLSCPDKGQPAQAWLCEGKSEGACSREQGKPVFIRHDDSSKGMLLYADNALSNDARLAVIRQDLGQNAFSVATFQSPDEFEAWFRQGGQGEKNKVAVMHISGCHSPSPLLFHRALLRMSEENRPLGMDLRLNGENLSLPLQHFSWRTVGVVGKEGVIRVDEVADGLRAYRAPGTVYLVQVLMRIDAALPVQASQPPSVTGELGSMVVTYTLELDHEYAVVGGHWGWIPRTGDPSFSVIGIPPVSLWTVTSRGKFGQGAADAAVVRQLQECSLQTPTGSVEVKTHVGLQKISYAECAMTAKP